MIPTLAQLIGNPAAVAAVTSPAIVGPIIDAFVKLGQIKAGLDFHGHWAPSVPIWTSSTSRRWPASSASSP